RARPDRGRHHEPARDHGGVGSQRPADSQRAGMAGNAERSAGGGLLRAARAERLVASYWGEGGKDRFRAQTGLPLASYFSGLKLKWLLDNVAGVRQRAEAGELKFGTIDRWGVWNLTGGVHGGLHITDVTNASRTQLMRLDSLAWDDEMLKAFSIPRSLLPRILSSSEVYGEIATGPLRGVAIAGILGDQQAALVGQTCFRPGEAKNTYGTGCFLLMNTGPKPVSSVAGLVTT